MRQNPFRTSLLAIALIGAVLGLILLIVGANPPVPAYEEFVDPLRGLPLLIWGGAILSLAIVSLFLWLHASAITWSVENPAASRGKATD